MEIMKTKIKTAILTLLSVLFFLNNSFATGGDQQSACLKINGIILTSPKGETGVYKVELFHKTLVIDSMFVLANEPFEFALSKNSLYTICLSKQGFIPFFIKVDTKLDLENLATYEFLFETELKPGGTDASSNEISEGLPIGTVRFDKINNRFYPIESEKTDPTCLKINGLILKSPKKEKGIYKVELLLDNTVVEAKEISCNKPFEFTLTKNAWYTVRITKDGFVPLLISVDTELGLENLTVYEFNFETELYHSTDVNYIDRDAFDLPIGLVRYDPSNNRFYPIDDYRGRISGSF